MAYETTVPLRFDDIDAAGQVNNARFATIFEEARFDFYRDVLGEDPRNGEAVVAHLEIDYHRPLDLGGNPTVRVSVTDIGETSVTLAYRVERGGEKIATGETVMVVYDFEAGEPRPVPETWRERLVDTRINS